MDLRPIFSAILLSTGAAQGAVLSGTIDSNYLFPDAGMTVSLQGAGVFINAQTVFTTPTLIGCTANCDFGLVTGLQSIGSATIGNTSSNRFGFSLSNTGSSADFTGDLTIYDSFGTTLAAASIETFLQSEKNTINLPYYEDTVYTFSDQSVPEPNTAFLVWAIAGVLYFKRRALLPRFQG